MQHEAANGDALSQAAVARPIQQRQLHAGAFGKMGFPWRVAGGLTKRSPAAVIVPAAASPMRPQ